jgi:hypothetical protein
MNLSQRITEATSQRFKPPENWEAIIREPEKGGVTFYSVWAGANDWEVGNSSVAVVDGKRRVWFKVKYPGSNDGSEVKRNEVEGVRSWGQKAVSTWVDEAKKFQNSHLSVWHACFQEALKSERMKPFVLESGVENVLDGTTENSDSQPDLLLRLAEALSESR